MNRTGITRQIDDLGRIVIPKEVRKTLCLREGELMEIIISDDSIVLTRASEFDGRKMFADVLVNSLFASCGIRTAICDRKTVISANCKTSGLEGREISDQLCEQITLGKEFLDEGLETPVQLLADSNKCPITYLVPFTAHGNFCGAIAVLEKGTAPLFRDMTENLRFAANALSELLKA